MNRTLVETVRSMLDDSRLPRSFWAEALSTAVHLRNCSPTKAVSGMTPFEAWTGEKPNVDYLRAFGCTAYSHIAKDERKKLDGKARKCILLGYGNETKGYRLYDPAQSRVIYSRDVRFNEYVRGFEEKRSEVFEQRKVSLHESDEEDTVTERPVEVNEPEQEPEPEPRRSTRQTT